MRVRMQDMDTGANRKTLSIHTAAGAKTVFCKYYILKHSIYVMERYKNEKKRREIFILKY